MESGDFLSLIQVGRKRLEKVGIEGTDRECELILMHLLKVPRHEIYVSEIRLDADTEKKFFDIINKRSKRIPLAYLLGEVGFSQDMFLVREGCLIPRPDTEVLIEGLKESLPFHRDDRFSFLDIGTGSGAIGISLLKWFSVAEGTLSDVSESALQIACENAKKLAVASRASFLKSDLFDALEPGLSWDVIVSNPPYLSAEDFKQLQPELEYEPRQALDGGLDGYDFYRRIIREAKDYLKREGYLAFEVGIGQAEQVAGWMKERHYKNVVIFKDLQGIDRVVIGQLDI